MRKEHQCCSEYKGNFYFYFNLDGYINIFLTFYDKVWLIAWPPAKSKYFTQCQRKEMNSDLFCLSQGDRYSQRPWTEATDLLPSSQKMKSWRQPQSYTQQKFTGSDWKRLTFLTSLPSGLCSHHDVHLRGKAHLLSMWWNAFVTHNLWS